MWFLSGFVPAPWLVSFIPSVFWLLTTSIPSVQTSLILGEPSCTVTEECPIGTVICDLEPLWDKLGVPVPIRTGFNKPPAASNAAKPPVHITVINEAKVFTVVGTQIVSRDRIDREQYVLTKQCRNAQHSTHEATDRNDADDEPNRVDCVIDLELAIVSTVQGHEQPTFVQLPIRIRDVNDHAPKFDQHNSGLWLEADEDNQSLDAVEQPGQRLISDSDRVRLPNSAMVVNSAGPHRRRELAVLPLASDVDYGVNGSIVYSLGGPDAEEFELEEEYFPPGADPIPTPSINLGGPLDRSRRLSRLRLIARQLLDHETKPQIRLILIARDQCPIKEMQRLTELPITLVVREVNEYPPAFELHPGTQSSSAIRIHPAVHFDYMPSGQAPATIRSGDLGGVHTQGIVLEVPEDMPVGSRLYQIVATDADTVKVGSDGSRSGTGTSRSPAGIHYVLASNADLKARRFVRISAADGWITLLHPLDYELGPKNLELPVLATDAGRPPRTSTLTVHIRVLDVNDEAPTIEVRGLGTGTGDAYHASVGLDPMSTGPMLHHVQTLTVRENAPPGTFVAKISTSDPDRGAAGEISCLLGDPLVDLAHQRLAPSISADNLASSRTDFLLQPAPSAGLLPHSITLHQDYHPGAERQGRRDADYVLLTRTRLDRETKAWYILNVVCHDHGDQLASSMNPHDRGFGSVRSTQTARSLSSTRLIKVIVLDENDNGPKFAKGHWNAQVAEHSKPGTKIVQLKATDDDAPGTASRSVYRLAQSSEWNVDNKTETDWNSIYEHFQVDNTTGWLCTGTRQLDREVRDKYSVPVVAYDMQFPNRTAMAWVHVQVTDINDNAPQLIGNSTFSIEEEESSVISQLTHATAFGDHGDGKTGRSGSRPIFVGHLHAQDLDSGDNGQVTFVLAPTGSNTDRHSNPLNWFLRPDGTLFVHSSPLAPLDREQQAVHLIPVIIKDHGSPKSLSSTATVTVSVLDRNDNAPQFERPSSSNPDGASTSTGDDSHSPLPRLPLDHVELTEATSPGTLIYTAIAQDPDQAENGLVVYSLEPYQGFWQLVHARQSSVNQGNSSSSSSNSHQNETNTQQEEAQPYFIIDQTTGEIRVNQRLSLLDSAIPRKLVIFAQDQGVPVRRSYAFLYIDLVSSLGSKFSTNGTEVTPVEPSASSSSSSTYSNSAVHHRRVDPSTQLTGTDAAQTRGSHPTSEGGEPRRRQFVDYNGNEPLHSERTATPGRTVGVRHAFSWNSELITGLGIGLVVLILICLLLLVTYAVHGSKILQRQHARDHRSRRMGSEKPNRVNHNNRIWLSSVADPGVAVSPTANENHCKGKVTHFRQTVRNVWNQRSRKADINELKSAPRQESPFTPTDPELIGDETRTARIYLARTSSPMGTAYYPDTCSNSPRDDTDTSSIPHTTGRYDPLPTLVGFMNPANDRWYVRRKMDRPSPNAQAYMCTSTLPHADPTSGGLVLDSLEPGPCGPTDPTYPSLPEGRSLDTYYTIRPDLMCRYSSGSMPPVHSTISLLSNHGNNESGQSSKLQRVTFTQNTTAVGLSSPVTGQVPRGGKGPDEQAGLGQATHAQASSAQHAQHQATPVPAPTQQPSSTPSATETRTAQLSSTEKPYHCPCATVGTKSSPGNRCTNTPKLLNDSSFV